MSISRLAALEATSVVMVAVIKLVGGCLGFITPKVNCVILESEPVGVMLVAAVALAAMSVRTTVRIAGRRGATARRTRRGP